MSLRILGMALMAHQEAQEEPVMAQEALAWGLPWWLQLEKVKAAKKSLQRLGVKAWERLRSSLGRLKVGSLEEAPSCKHCSSWHRPVRVFEKQSCCEGEGGGLVEDHKKK